MDARDSLVPQLLDAIVLHAREHLYVDDPDVTVSDGYAMVNNPGDYLWVGIEDPYSAGPSASVRASQEWVGASRISGRDETGQITCCLESWNGEADMKLARDRVYALLAPLAMWLRSAPGAIIPGLARASIDSTDLDQAPYEDGMVAVRLIIRIGFKGRI